jgi:hypothetical protein
MSGQLCRLFFFDSSKQHVRWRKPRGGKSRLVEGLHEPECVRIYLHHELPYWGGSGSSRSGFLRRSYTTRHHKRMKIAIRSVTETVRRDGSAGLLTPRSFPIIPWLRGLFYFLRNVRALKTDRLAVFVELGFLGFTVRAFRQWAFSFFQTSEGQCFRHDVVIIPSCRANGNPLPTGR